MVGITSHSSFKKLDFRFSDVAGEGSVWGGVYGVVTRGKLWSGRNEGW